MVKSLIRFSSDYYSPLCNIFQADVKKISFRDLTLGCLTNESVYYLRWFLAII